MKAFDMAVVKRLLKYTRPYTFFLVTALVSSVIYISLTLLAPVLIGNAIDYIIGPQNVFFDKILPILIYLFFTVIGASLFQWVMSYCTNTLAYRTIKDMRTDVFNKLSRTPLKFIDSNAHGDLMSRVTVDIEQISDGLLQGFTQLFTGVVTIVGTLLFMLSVDPIITLVVVLVTPLSLFVASFIAKRSYNMFRIQSQTRGELGGYVEEIIGNQKLVKTFFYEDRAQKNFEEINSRLYDCGVKAQFYSSLTNPCTRFVNGIVYALVGIIGALSAVSGRLSVGEISCFLTYANQYTKPFNEISGVVTELQSAFASAARVFKVLDEPEETDDSNLYKLKECEGNVDIENVSFSYSPKTPLIENFNLNVKSGSRIAIVGPTGCGKTTFINLLMRFYDVTGGTISIDGNKITDITRQSLRSKYGMVLQESWLFSGTVRENIAYGKPDATDDEIIAAAKSAHAHSFIKRLPDGYDTVITEAGANLSQGQRQLLCIARVMLVDPPMLILDEATSSIDTMTEIRIQRAFTKMMEGRTSFIVAHRLSTIKEADLILVMNAGKIIEQGTHEELLKKGGFYANLYQSQFMPAE